MVQKAVVALTLLVSSAGSASGESITVERGPCLGECPVYRFQVSPTGEGTFDGRRFTTVHGAQRISFTQQEWASFRSALAPFRPKGTEDITAGHPLCRRMSTDHPTVAVTWVDENGTDRLFFNFGCKDRENAPWRRRSQTRLISCPLEG